MPLGKDEHYSIEYFGLSCRQMEFDIRNFSEGDLVGYTSMKSG